MKQKDLGITGCAAGSSHIPKGVRVASTSVAFSSTLDCGTYSSCDYSFRDGYSTASDLTVYCNLFTGFVYKVDIREHLHESRECLDKKSAVKHHIVYKMKKGKDQKDKDHAVYEGSLKTATAQFSDYARAKKELHIKCSTNPGAWPRNMEDLKCENDRTFDMYSWVKEIKSKPPEVYAMFEARYKTRMVTLAIADVKWYEADRFGIFMGCWPWWLVVMTLILVSVVALSAVVGAKAYRVKRKEPRSDIEKPLAVEPVA